MNFESIINQLKNRGLVSDDDIVIVTREGVSSGTAIMFGAIGAALSAVSKDDVIFTASQNEIKIFDIDNETGTYLEDMMLLKREDIANAGLSRMSGNFFIKMQSGDKFQYAPLKKYKGRIQKDEIKQIKELFKLHYK